MRVIPIVDLNQVNSTWFNLKIKRQTVQELEYIPIEKWSTTNMNQFSITIQIDTSQLTTFKGDIFTLEILSAGSTILLNSIIKQITLFTDAELKEVKNGTTLYKKMPLFI